MRKALLITIVFLLLTLSITQSAIAQRQNIITNQTTEPLYVVYSTKFGAHDAIPAGYWTAGWKEIQAGQQEAFWAYDPHKIYFQIWKGSQRVKPLSSTQTLAFWINRNADFNVVTQQEINASITRGQLVYSSHDTSALTHSDGFMRYNNGSRIAVTNAWVDVDADVNAGLDRVTDRQVFVWDPVETLSAHTGAINALAWHPTDGQRLVSVSSDRTVRVWHFAEDITHTRLTGHTGAVLDVAWEQDGTEFHSTSSDGTILAWSPRTGFIEVKVKKTYPIVAISLKGALRLYTTEPEETSVDLSWDAKRAVIGFTDNTIQVTTVRPYNHLHTLTGHTGSVNAVVWSPDDMRIVSGSADRTVRVWDPQTGELLKTLRGHTGSVNTVAWSPDGTRIVSGSDDGTVRIWDAETGELLETLREHTGAVNAVAWSPDGTRIASGGVDNIIRLWEKPDDSDMMSDGFDEEVFDSDMSDGDAQDVSQPVNIPDVGLRSAIEEALGKTSGATISPADMRTLTELDAREQDIQDITGLEFATNLTALYLNENEISDVSALIQLKELRTLWLYVNQISDIAALAQLTNLTSLSLSHNQLSDVSALANLKRLKTLWIDGNQISDIAALAQLTDMRELSLPDNQISDVSPLVELKNLTRLHLVNNHISDVSPLAGLTNLRELYLSKNKISDFSPIAGLIPNLKVYENSDQRLLIVHIPDPNLRAAIEEQLGKAQGTPITQAEMQTLTQLDARKRGIQDLIGIEFATNLEDLYLFGNEISDISPLAQLKSLGHLYLSENEISDISPLAQLSELRDLGLGTNQISDFSPLAELKQLWGLDIRKSQISDISPLTQLNELTHLYLSDNQISDISPLTQLNKLTWVDLSDNQISDISPLVALKQLGGVNLADNQISDISPLAELKNLTRLFLWRNQISDISPLAELKQLEEYLNLADNQISDISPLAGLNKLTRLSLWGNQISDVSPLAGLKNLTHLHISINQISDVSPLAGLKNLIELKLTNNQISDFAPIAGLVKNLEVYENSPQLKSRIPNSVEISGPTTVPSVVKDYRFTATVKNDGSQVLGNFEVTVNGKDTVQTNAFGVAEFKLNFPSVGTHHINLTVRDKESVTEFQQHFPNRVEVLKPDSIEIVRDFREIEEKTFYTADFVVRSADGQALEGFQVKLNVGKWVFETIGTAQVPIPDVLRATPNVTELLRDDDANSRIHDLDVFGWRVKSVASDRFNTAITDGEGRVVCSQRLFSTGFYGVSATVILNGQGLLTTSFSAGDAPNMKIIHPGRTLSIDDANTFYRVPGGWKLLKLRGGFFPFHAGDILKNPPVDPPSYRVKVIPSQDCEVTVPSQKVLATAEKLETAFVAVRVPSLFSSTSGVEEAYPDVTPSNSTTSLDRKVRWRPATTLTKDIGVTVITVRFLDGTDTQIETVKKAFYEWQSTAPAKVYFIYSEGEEHADIRVTFGEKNKPTAGPGTTIHGRSDIGPKEWMEKANDILTSRQSGGFWDALGAAVFDWVGYESQWAKLLRQVATEIQNVQDMNTMWLETDFTYGTALHEIGHALGFYHPHHTSVFAKTFKEWPPPESKRPSNITDAIVETDGEPAVDQYSIMTYEIDPDLLIPRAGARSDLKEVAETGISKQRNTLSPGDKKALANVYGRRPYNGWQPVHLTGTLGIYGVDDEIGRNDTINEGGIPIDIYVGPQDEKYEFVSLRHFKWGGEVRVEVDIGARRMIGGQIEMAIRLRLYEGTYEETEDLDGEVEETFLVPTRNIDAAEYPFLVSGEDYIDSFKVKNSDEGGDWARVTLRLWEPADPPQGVIAESIPTSEEAAAAPSSETGNLFSASDINGDGQVDTADLVLISNYLGQPAPENPPVDVNGDGFVTIADLVHVAQYLGQSMTASAPVRVTVPVGLKYAMVEGWIDQARVENDGSFAFHQGIAKLEYLLTLIIPEKTALLPNYPNPFNPETWIPYHLAEPAEVRLTIYAINGRVVRRLDLGHQDAGYYQSKSRAAYWDGRNAVGERVASGIYFYTLTVGDFAATKKLLIRK